MDIFCVPFLLARVSISVSKQCCKHYREYYSRSSIMKECQTVDGEDLLNKLFPFAILLCSVK